jgi:hypothetical protein
VVDTLASTVDQGFSSFPEHYMQFHNNKKGSPLVRLPAWLPAYTIFLAGWTCLVSRLMRSVSYRDSGLYIELSVQNTPVQYQYKNQNSMPMETCICAGGMS